MNECWLVPVCSCSNQLIIWNIKYLACAQKVTSTSEYKMDSLHCCKQKETFYKIIWQKCPPHLECKLTPTTRSLSMWSCDLDLCPFELILYGWGGLMMDYTCGKFRDCDFRRFDSIVRPDRQQYKQTRMKSLSRVYTSATCCAATCCAGVNAA